MSELLRATPVGVAQQIINNLDATMNSLATTQEDLSTGNAVNQPSDAPGEIGPILATDALVSRTSQYQTNANDGLAFLSQANSAINQASSLLVEAEQLITSLRGPNSQMGNAPPAQVAAQLQGVVANLTTVANTTYLGIPVFGGTTGSQYAFDPTGSGNYLGSATALTRTVAPGLSLKASVVGSAVFGDNAVNPATSVFGILNKAVADATAPANDALLATDEANLQAAFTNFQAQGATLGGMYQAMQQAQQQADQTHTVLQNQVGNLVQVNIAQATTNLQLEQTNYQSALWAAAQLNKYSLIQFVA